MPENGVRDVVGGRIIKRGSGPPNAALDWRPDAEERAVTWKGEPPSFYERWHRRVYNVNKQLTEDLCGGITIKVFRNITLSPLRDLIGNQKHWP